MLLPEQDTTRKGRVYKNVRERCYFAIYENATRCMRMLWGRYENATQLKFEFDLRWHDSQ